MLDSKTEYLYGDSTPAPLKTDFIAFLRDMVDFAVEVLHSEGQAAEASQASAWLEEATEKVVANAEALAAHVSEVLDRPELGGSDPFLARCAARIRSATWETVRAEASAARAEAEAGAARAALAVSSARAECEKALEGLLLRQDVPDAVTVVKLCVGDGARYDARLTARTPWGLSWEIGLQIPSSHSLARVLRIDRLVERLEIRVPEEPTWPPKASKPKAQRLDRLYLTELVLAPAEAFIKLRATPEGTGAGCNLWLHRDVPAVRLERVLASGGAADSPFDIEGEDAGRLRLLHDELAALMSEIAQNRQPPVAIEMDDTPVGQHRACAVIERLISSVAPRVEEIAKRSLAPGELVLRRRLGDNHREEVFLSKAELLEKIEPLPPALRGAFAPLNLWEGVSPSPDAQPAPVTAASQGIALGALRSDSKPTQPAARPGDEEPTVIVDESAWSPAQGAVIRKDTCFAPGSG